MDVNNQEIISAVLSTNEYHDKELLEDLLEGVETPLGDALGDGGYDSHASFELICQKGGNPIIPPRKDAKIRCHGNCKEKPLARDQVLRQMRKISRKRWKQETHYHRRSLIETAMFRVKTIFGDKLSNRVFEHQATEAFIRCRALNLMTQMGMPESYKII